MGDLCRTNKWSRKTKAMTDREKLARERAIDIIEKARRLSDEPDGLDFEDTLEGVVAEALLEFAAEQTKEIEEARAHVSIHANDLADQLHRLQEQKSDKATTFETSVGRVKCHDESSVVFFSVWPDASNWVGKRVKVSLQEIV